MKSKIFYLLVVLFFSAPVLKAQNSVQVYPQANNLKGYVFDGQLNLVKNLPVQGNTFTVNYTEFQSNKYYVVITSSSGYYYIGTSQEIASNKKIQLTQSAPLPWISIANKTRLINAQNQYINIHAHGGLTYSINADLLGIIRLKLLGFNGFRLVFRSFDSSSNRLPGLYIKTGTPFNNTISGFTDAYIDQYLVPKIQLAKLLGMYVILDHHDMFIHDKNVMNEYETNPNEYNAWLEMWKHLSLRFKNEPAIAIYEVQNEPGFKMSGDFVLKMHNDVIKLIRQNDTNHLIAFGHSWQNVEVQMYLDKGIPYDPAHKLIFTVHHYLKPHQMNAGLTYKIGDAVKLEQKYQVPIWFGETGFKNNYSQPVQNMIEQWYDYADKNFISTSIWRDDDIMGKHDPNGNADYVNAMNIKKRIFLSESSDWNIRCFRKDYNNGRNYIITNPNASSKAHLKINYPVINSISISSVSPDKQAVKIVDSKKGYAIIDGNFKSIEISLN